MTTKSINIKGLWSSLYPSSKMEIISYIPNGYMELSGGNHWLSIIFSHCVLWILSLLPFIFFYLKFGYSLILTILCLLAVYFLVVFTGIMVLRARSKEYSREEIRFTPNGIYLKDDKNSPEYKKVKTSSLVDAKIILTGHTLKFMIYGLDSPYFKFKPSSFSSELPSSRKILQSIVSILDLEIHHEVRLGTSLIFDLKAVDRQSYQPKYYHIQELPDKLILRAKHNEDSLYLVPGVIEVLLEDRIFRYRWQTPFFLSIDMKEILTFDIDVVDKTKTKSIHWYVEGQVYVITRGGGKHKVFVANQQVDRQEEIMKLDLLRDFEYLKYYLSEKLN